MFKVGSLFTGIGGIELGLERTGYFKTIWFVENNEFCRSILKRHWPDIPCHGDITELDFSKLPEVDMLAGGFPCQDISVAGKGAGIKEGTRSGLWFHFARAIGVLRPRYALIENVPMLVKRGLDVVLADLAEAGYDAEWFDLRASDFGALHRRERIFIVAYNRHRFNNESGNMGQGGKDNRGRIPRRENPECIIAHDKSILESSPVGNNGQVRKTREDALSETPECLAPHAHGDGFDGAGLPILQRRPRQDSPRDEDGAVADPDAIEGNEVHQGQPDLERRVVADDFRERAERFRQKKVAGKRGFSWCEDVRRVEDLRGRPDIPEPLFRGARDGVPDWVDRIKALGNAVVPDCAEFIGEMIMEYDMARKHESDFFVELGDHLYEKGGTK